MVYQSVVSPALVVARAWTCRLLAPGVSAFHEATRRVKLAVVVMMVDVQVPETSPPARARWSLCRMVPLSAPVLKPDAAVSRVRWIGSAVAASAGGPAESMATTKTPASSVSLTCAEVYETGEPHNRA